MDGIAQHTNIVLFLDVNEYSCILAVIFNSLSAVNRVHYFECKHMIVYYVVNYI